jgi:ribosomal protein S18 acetylase RimI-like enzyme
MTITYAWRDDFASHEVASLHAEAFGNAQPTTADERARLERHSLGWVCARDGGVLVGLVNVAWDGDVHAFILDTAVAASHRRQGIATRLVQIATDGARAAGCEWLHVDFEPHLRGFYFDVCGFVPTDAGLIALR